MSVEIKLTKGYVAIVDEEDAYLADKHWFAAVGKYTVYAHRWEYLNGVLYRIKLHDCVLGCVLGCGKGLMPDHIDGNGLNNRRSNLRIATKQLNAANSGSRPGSSKYKGVFWAKDREQWRAQIQINGKRTHIGSFTEEEDAATAYNFVAYESFGEFARLNLPLNKEVTCSV